MTFSTEWDIRYSESQHLSVWPWSDLISYYYRHAKPLSNEVKVLEIGFGAGANIPFFKAINVDYSGIEGSQTICELVAKKYPDLAHKFYVGDFLTHKFPEKFDVIIDRASMTHNSTVAIRRGLSHLADCLNPGGKYIGIDWFSTKHSDYLVGDVVDEFTRTNMKDGQFVGVGNVHFSDEGHLRDLFSNYEITVLEEKCVCSFQPRNNHVFASWNLVAIKK